MKTLNTVEIEEVVGGFTFGSLPFVTSFPFRPIPQPSEEPVPTERPVL